MSTTKKHKIKLIILAAGIAAICIFSNVYASEVAGPPRPAAMKPTSTPTPTATPKPTATPTTAPTEEPTPDPSGYSIRYENGKAVVNAPSGKYAVIFAAYDSDGKLISVAVKQDAEITKANQSVYPNKFTTAGAAAGKIMLWDNLNNMVPRAAASIPFN